MARLATLRFCGSTEFCTASVPLPFNVIASFGRASAWRAAVGAPPGVALEPLPHPTQPPPHPTALQ